MWFCCYNGDCELDKETRHVIIYKCELLLIVLYKLWEFLKLSINRIYKSNIRGPKKHTFALATPEINKCWNQQSGIFKSKWY